MLTLIKTGIARLWRAIRGDAAHAAATEPTTATPCCRELATAAPIAVPAPMLASIPAAILAPVPAATAILPQVAGFLWRAPAERHLAARLAVTARLNVPQGRKARPLADASRRTQPALRIASARPVSATIAPIAARPKPHLKLAAVTPSKARTRSTAPLAMAA